MQENENVQKSVGKFPIAGACFAGPIAMDVGKTSGKLSATGTSSKTTVAAGTDTRVTDRH